MKCRRIMLTGFMGSGKSTVGRALAARLRYPFADTDALIEEREGRKVSDIFSERGEAHFRHLEHRITHDLTRDDSLVVSSGGGYIMTNAVYQIAAANFTIVYIDTPFDLCLQRIKDDKKRPLAAGRADEELHRLFLRRKSLYRVRCDFSVDGSKDTASIVEDILAQWTC